MAINPGTPADAAAEMAGVVDILLCMTVNPGWGGQPFIESSPGKVERLVAAHPEARVEVDGGIDPSTAGSVAEAGAGLFVAGSAIFGSADPAAAYREIAAAALIYTASTQVLSISIWAFFENANWGVASALSVIATLITVTLMAAVMRAPLRL